MAQKTLTARQKQKYDTASNWTTNNPILLAGEIGIESDTLKFKVGDGTTAWNILGYAGGSSGTATDVKVDSVSITSGGVANLVTKNGDYNANTNKLATENDIPTVPTNVSAFTNDAGYLTSHQTIKTLDTTATTAQSTNASEAIAGSGTVTLHKVSKTGTLADLIEDSSHRSVSDTEKTTWSGKQDALTFDTTPTANSNNPVTSGGVYTAYANNQASINSVLAQITPTAWQTATANSTYVNSGSCLYLKIGSIVIVKVENVTFKAVAQSHDIIIFSGLPNNSTQSIVQNFTCQGSPQTTVRYRVNINTGRLVNYWSSFTPNTNQTWSGFLVYITDEI